MEVNSDVLKLLEKIDQEISELQATRKRIVALTNGGPVKVPVRRVPPGTTGSGRKVRGVAKRKMVRKFTPTNPVWPELSHSDAVLFVLIKSKRKMTHREIAAKLSELHHPVGLSTVSGSLSHHKKAQRVRKTREGWEVISSHTKVEQ